MQTVFVVNLNKYPYHQEYLYLFSKIAEKYGNVQVFNMASAGPLHEKYYKIADSGCDFLISFDCAGFELRTENDTLSYNNLGCRMAHILFQNMREYGENIRQQMNFSMFVFSAVLEDVVTIQKNFPNIPNVEFLEIPHDCRCTGSFKRENDVWVKDWFFHIIPELELDRVIQ